MPILRPRGRGFGALLGVLLLGCGGGDPAPEPLFEVAPFALVDQDGRPFGSEDLAGHVYVADFVFTSCPDICPVLTTQLANLTRRLADAPEVRFVSLSVDPEIDTPERLRSYADRFGADRSRWTFLTGEPDTVRNVIMGGFRVGVRDRVELEGGAYDIPHSPRFVLVDREGRVRGFYESDGPGLERLEAHVRGLVGGGG